MNLYFLCKSDGPMRDRLTRIVVSVEHIIMIVLKGIKYKFCYFVDFKILIKELKKLSKNNIKKH